MGKLRDILQDAPGMGWGATGNLDDCEQDVKTLVETELKQLSRTDPVEHDCTVKLVDVLEIVGKL